MARTDERFREAYNRLLALCATAGPGGALPSEIALSDQLDVSRTVIRAALQRLRAQGLIAWNGREKRPLRVPRPEDWLQSTSSPVTAPELERQFLEWILRFDVAPGTALNAAELARRFNVTAHMLHEFLASLSRFGLVRRRAKGGWELLGFTRDFALELSEFRHMLEMHAVAHVVDLPASHPIWTELDSLEARHLRLAAEIDDRFHDFSLLDGEFHRALGATVKNRFAAEFSKLISLIFHYHFQWDKTEERIRNAAAIKEHLALIHALKSRNKPAALAAADEHLKTSKLTLIQSLRDHKVG